MMKILLKWLLMLFFRVEVKGLDNYRQAGDRVLIVANHTSFLDAPLLGTFLPGFITFAINTGMAERWWVKPFLGLSKVFTIDPTQPLSLKSLIHYLQQTDSKTVIFPEGRLTATGALMKTYDGAGMVAEKSGATVLPIRIDGAQYSHFSLLHNIVRLRLFPKITLHILPPVKLEGSSGLNADTRRKHSGMALADIMTEMVFASSHYRQTLFSALLAARRIHGGKHTVAEDLDRIPLSYDALITRSIALANAVKPFTKPAENVGVLLPNSTKTLCVVLGLHVYGRIPAMLNFTVGAAGMVSACQTAKVGTVLTSRRFIDLGKLENEAAELAKHVNVVYLEDVAKKISPLDKIKALLQSKTTRHWYKPKQTPDSPAVVLFTSGSEGTPKGVVLSHANILANHAQVGACISFTPQDVVLNFLPMFHSFGFTVGSLLPVLHGMTTFFYPTPLHFSAIPEIAYEINATIMFGTNTFLAAYGKQAHVYDFYSIRYVVAGAEKLHDSTRQLWADKFGIRILEGYGATETAPVAAVNTPMCYKAGTVGRLMPAMSYRLEPVEGIPTGGKLHLKGPNVMLGYLLSDQPGQLRPATSVYGEGWYDTGDIVNIDEEGFVSIQGRIKRFAKVGGEMVSLTLIEQLAAAAWPLAQHAAINLPDAKKGEQIILVTTQEKADLADFTAVSKGIAAICLPKKIVMIENLPVLGNGKINYIALTDWVKENAAG